MLILLVKSTITNHDIINSSRYSIRTATAAATTAAVTAAAAVILLLVLITSNSNNSNNSSSSSSCGQHQLHNHQKQHTKKSKHQHHAEAFTKTAAENSRHATDGGPRLRMCMAHHAWA